MKPFDLLLLFHRFELSDFQRKLFILILSKVTIRGQKNTYVFQFKARNIMLEVNPTMTYEQLQTETRHLCSRIYEINENQRLIQTSLLSSAVFLKGTGIIEVTLSRTILPYIKVLRTSYRLQIINHVLSFKSTYSIKLYFALLDMSNDKAFTWNITDLKNYLNNNYKDYNTFKKRTILQAQKELHLTDMAFTFQEEKVGRKVEKLIFKIQPISHLYFNQEQKSLIKKLIKKLEITESQACKIVLKFIPEEIHTITYNILEKYREGKITNSLGAYSVGFFNKLI